MKKMKTERESAGDFFNPVFIFCLKYLTTRMITKRLKGCVPYLYTQLKYKSVLKTKQGKVIKS